MKHLLAASLFLVMITASRGLLKSISKKLHTSTPSKSLLFEMSRNWAADINKRASSSTTLSGTAGHLAVHVKGVITPGESSNEQFFYNTLMNARNSILEDGISRFDVLNRIDNSGEFLLVEVYNSINGPSDHKLTAHYNSWRENVADLMHQPRTAVKYTTLFPRRSNWRTDASAGTIDEKSFMKNSPWTQGPFASGSSLTGSSMLAVAVDVEVVEGGEDAFIMASLENCCNSIKEPGVTRFDFMQNNDNPRNFLLFEVYNNENGPVEHKATEHYAAWASAVKDLMAKPRTAIRYATRFPAPLYWHRNSFFTHPSSVEEGVEEGEAEGASRGLSSVTGNSFGFLSPTITIGRGIAVQAISASLKNLKIQKPFIVTGKGGFSRLRESLFIPCGAISNNWDESCLFCVGSEPTVEDAKEATSRATAAGCDGVLCVGGGSALDLGKAVAALMTNKDDIYNYLEIIGKGIPIQNKPAPLIAVPTTSGTGSECTKNAVLKSLAHGRKVSMRHDSMLPLAAIIDPCLSVSCPQQVTAHVGLDTLCQLIEPYISNAANPIVDALAKEGIVRAARSLRAVVANGNDLTAREDLAIASVLGGLCLANAKLGAVHGYAAVLGGMFERAPHGAICAVLLPHVFRKNAEKLAVMSANGDNSAKQRLSRFREVARMITGLEVATVAQGVTWLEILVKDLNVPTLSNVCDVKMDQLKIIAEATAGSSSTKGNPVVLSIEELEEILTKAF